MKKTKANIIVLHTDISPCKEGLTEQNSGKHIPICLLQGREKALCKKNFSATKGRASHSIPSDCVILINPDNEAIMLKAVKGYTDQSSPLTSFKELCWGGKKNYNSISLEESIPH